VAAVCHLIGFLSAYQHSSSFINGPNLSQILSVATNNAAEYPHCTPHTTMILYSAVISDSVSFRLMIVMSSPCLPLQQWGQHGLGCLAKRLTKETKERVQIDKHLHKAIRSRRAS